MNDSLRILLVDDEPLARYACRKLIHEKFSGYTVVGEASTGPEALHAFRTLEPDIILMDIELPEINGLEVSLLILKESPETQIIIVSAYERFGYAQKAINTGVLGYVVKPIQEPSLRNLLESARKNIAHSQKFAREQNEFHLYRSLAIKDMVTAFIHGSYGGLTAESFALLLSQPISEGMFIVCSVKKQETCQTLKEEDRSLFEQVTNRFSNCYAGHWIGSVIPIFVSTFVDSSSPTHTEIGTFVREFVRYVQAKTGFILRVCTGLWQTNPTLFPSSFQQAFDLLHTQGTEAIQMYRCEENLPIDTLMHKEGIERDVSSFEPIETQLITALVHGKQGQSREATIAFSTWMTEQCLSETAMRYAITELLIQIRRNHMLHIHPKLQELIQSLLRVLDTFETREQILDWFPTAIDHIIRITDESISTEETNIQKILHYIDLNDLGSTISLENVAQFIGLTPQYISKLFKQQFNINFIDYVIQRRIDLACTLLKTSSLTIREVSMRCGYNDLSYFAKVFSKFTGMTPREYRQKSR